MIGFLISSGKISYDLDLRLFFSGTCSSCASSFFFCSRYCAESDLRFAAPGKLKPLICDGLMLKLLKLVLFDSDSRPDFFGAMTDEGINTVLLFIVYEISALLLLQAFSLLMCSIRAIRYKLVFVWRTIGAIFDLFIVLNY